MARNSDFGVIAVEVLRKYLSTSELGRFYYPGSE